MVVLGLLVLSFYGEKTLILSGYVRLCSANSPIRSFLFDINACICSTLFSFFAVFIDLKMSLISGIQETRKQESLEAEKGQKLRKWQHCRN